MMDGSGSGGRAGHNTWVGLWVSLVATGMVAGSLGQGCASDHETTYYPNPEAGVREGGGGGDGGTTATCPSDVPVDAKTLLWKPPTPLQPGKCRDEDIAATKAYLAANPSASNADFENFVKNRDRGCHDCIFADADGQTWPPAPVKDGKVVTFNVGACYAITTGSQQCGRAIQNAWDCGFEACLLCTSADALATCRAKARTGACKAFEEKAHADCTGPGIADEVCGSPFDSIRLQCMTAASPIADAGTD